MSVNPGPPGKGAKRLSPDELAQEVASLLKGGASGHPERRLRIDIVTLSRIVMALAVVLFGVGVAVAVPWIGGLVGFETPGMVIQGGPVVGCPGEIEIGEVFKGETVQVVGRTDDGVYFAVRDERGPGDVVYVDARQSLMSMTKTCFQRGRASPGTSQWSWRRRPPWARVIPPQRR